MKLQTLICFTLSLILSFSAFSYPKSINYNPYLTDRQTQNLYAFAKAYGYVKYFYPLKKKEKINWHYIAATGAQKVLYAANDASLKQELSNIFKPIAPLLIFHTQPDTTYNANTTSENSYYYNLHQGLGQDKDDLPLLTRKLSGSVYKSSIIAVDYEKYKQLTAAGTILSADSLYTARLSDNLFCSLPLTVTEQTFNNNNAYKRYNKHYKLKLENHQNQLATVIVFWNIFQHFHPYLDNTIGWDKVFFETIAKVSPSMTESEFIHAASNITSSLNDGHASLSYSNGSGIYKRPVAPAVETGWVENKLVVTKNDLTGKDLQQGDIIETINGTAATDLVKQLDKNTSVANKKNRNLKAAELILNRYLLSGKHVSMVIIDSTGNKKEVKLDAKAFQVKEEKETDRTAIQEIEPGIFYLDASRTSDKDIKANLTALKQAKGIVFDLRKRPSNEFTSTVFPYFIHTELETGNWSIPTYTFPDQRRVYYKPVAKWHIRPNGETIVAPKAFLIGHNTFSYGETCAEIIDHYDLGTIVGGFTASTNGNINFSGAGKLQVLWTGMKVSKRDGSPYHGVGIEPDIHVLPTIEDIRNGKDTQLNAAIEHLKKESKLY